MARRGTGRRYEWWKPNINGALPRIEIRMREASGTRSGFVFQAIHPELGVNAEGDDLVALKVQVRKELETRGLAVKWEKWLRVKITRPTGGYRHSTNDKYHRGVEVEVEHLERCDIGKPSERWREKGSEHNIRRGQLEATSFDPKTVGEESEIEILVPETPNVNSAFDNLLSDAHAFWLLIAQAYGGKGEWTDANEVASITNRIVFAPPPPRGVIQRVNPAKRRTKPRRK